MLEIIRRNVFGIALITAMWVIMIPGSFFFLTRGIDLPSELSLLVLVPVLLIWVPVSYPMVIAGNERHMRGEDPVTLGFLAESGVMGFLTAVLCLLVVWIHAMFHAGAYLGMAFVGALGLLCTWAVFLSFRRLLKYIEPHSSVPR